MFDFNSILITGGTGSFGKRLLRKVLEEMDIERVIVFSRDELKQFELSHQPWIQPHLDRVRFFLGDVRDRERLSLAFEGIDVVGDAAFPRAGLYRLWGQFRIADGTVITTTFTVDAS